MDESFSYLVNGSLTDEYIVTGVHEHDEGLEMELDWELDTGGKEDFIISYSTKRKQPFSYFSLSYFLASLHFLYKNTPYNRM